MDLCEYKTKILYEFQGDPVLERVGGEEEEKEKNSLLLSLICLFSGGLDG